VRCGTSDAMQVWVHNPFTWVFEILLIPKVLSNVKCEMQEDGWHAGVDALFIPMGVNNLTKSQSLVECVMWDRCHVGVSALFLCMGVQNLTKSQSLT
jgi:hypothetical protein